MREFSRKYMMIHREVLGLSWLLSILTKMAVEEIKNRIWGEIYESLVQHPWLIKEPNVNDHGFICI